MQYLEDVYTSVLARSTTPDSPRRSFLILDSGLEYSEALTKFSGLGGRKDLVQIPSQPPRSCGY